MDDLVERFYQPLYRFALSLTRNEATACDHVQETFYLYASKGHQLRDKARAKSWLFTTLYRDFLGARRRGKSLVFEDFTTAEPELPPVWPDAMRMADSNTVLQALQALDESFRAPLVLFYLEGFSYKEIAEALELPVGTVMSRLSRGKEQLRRQLSDPAAAPVSNVVPFRRAK